MQLDVKNAFLRGFLNTLVYMQQPLGYIDSNHPMHVCKLHKALYGLKQAPRTWFDRLSDFLLQQNFYSSQADPQGILIILLYVDDIVLTSDNLHRINCIIS